MNRFLIVLDLNGTLLHRLTKSADKKAAALHPSYRKPDAVVKKCPIYLRPHLQSFLGRILSFADVAVWTSAKRENAFPMVRAAFHSHLDNHNMHPLKFVWSQEECQIHQSPRVKGCYKPDFRKPLTQIWHKYKRLYSEENTIIIDDSFRKVSGYERNHISIPEFRVTDADYDFESDRILLILGDYLNKLHSNLTEASSSNTNSIEKDTFFLQAYLAKHPPSFNISPIITETDSDQLTGYHNRSRCIIMHSCKRQID